MAKSEAESRPRPTRGLWTEARMHGAMEKVKNRELSLSEASKTFDIPKATLFWHIAGKNKITKGNRKHVGLFEQTFDKDFVEELQQYVFDMEERLFGITNINLRRLAYQLAEHNALKQNFNKTKHMAGKKLLYVFRKPHLKISARKATSFARDTGFNKPVVKRFFNLLGSVIEKHYLHGSKIYNCDETRVKTVQQQYAKVLEKSCKHQL